MGKNLKEVFQEAAQLPELDCATLAGLLIETLDHISESDVEAAWSEEKARAGRDRHWYCGIDSRGRSSGGIVRRVGMIVRLYPEARAVLLDARRWYHDRSPLSATAFAHTVDNAVSRIRRGSKLLALRTSEMTTLMSYRHFYPPGSCCLSCDNYAERRRQSYLNKLHEAEIHVFLSMTVEER
jgi:hypothetical protein